MIRDPNAYARESARQRRQFLQHLTYDQSARLTEGLLAATMIQRLHFLDDDHPIALAWQVRRKRTSSP